MIGKKLKKHLDVFVEEKKQEMIDKLKDPSHKAVVQAWTTEDWIENHFKGMVIQWHGQKEAKRIAEEMSEIEDEKKEQIPPIDVG